LLFYLFFFIIFIITVSTFFDTIYIVVFLLCLGIENTSNLARPLRFQFFNQFSLVVWAFVVGIVDPDEIDNVIQPHTLGLRYITTNSKQLRPVVAVNVSLLLCLDTRGQR